MPKPTLSELVRDIDQSVTVLKERVKGIDQCDADVERLSDDLSEVKDRLHNLYADFATVREKAAALEKAIDQINQRRWTLVVAIISAFLGGILTLLIQVTVRLVFK